MKQQDSPMITSLSNITWRQLKNIVKSADFPGDIKNISDDQLRKSFREFNVVPSDKEIEEFRKFVVKVVCKESHGEYSCEIKQSMSFIDRIVAMIEFLNSRSEISRFLRDNTSEV